MDRMVWVDCEMTGLDVVNDALIEIACLVTDSELNILGEGVDFVMAAPEGALDKMDPVVVDMHASSGLADEVRAATLTVAEAEAKVLDYVREHVPEAGKAPLAGNTVGTDRGFLARDMPALDAYLHYRIVDVSSVKELVRRWYPKVYYAAPRKDGGHRALADIRDSIRELRYYRSAVFVAPPGPTAQEATALALALDEAPAAQSAPPPPTEVSQAEPPVH